MVRLVLDTNVWLDWLVFDDPGLKDLREAHAAGRAEIFIDEPCEAELRRVLAYDLGKHTLEPYVRDEVIQKVSQLTSKSASSHTLVLPRCSDPDDQKLLHLTAASGADALVTKDAALLELARKAPFRVVTPAQLALLLAYGNSDYVVLEPKLVLHVGEPSAALDELLESHGERTAAFVTAANPGSKPRPKAENQAANQKLLESQRLLSRTCLEGEGRAPDRSWAERSFLVLGIPLAEAEALGRSYGQNAIVFCEKGRPPELVLIGL